MTMLSMPDFATVFLLFHEDQTEQTTQESQSDLTAKALSATPC
jgi:hypothetical protein